MSTTVQLDYVWTHESAGSVEWRDGSDVYEEGVEVAWLTGDVEIAVGPTGWWVTLFTGCYPFVMDAEIATGSTDSKTDAKWQSIRAACRWLVALEAEDWMMRLLEDGWTDPSNSGYWRHSPQVS